MAIEKVYLSEGVSLVDFDARTHSYRKLTQIVGDDDDGWGTPVYVDIIDDGEVHLNAGGGNPPDLEAIGVVVATSPTSAPV